MITTLTLSFPADAPAAAAEAIDATLSDGCGICSAPIRRDADGVWLGGTVGQVTPVYGEDDEGAIGTEATLRACCYACLSRVRAVFAGAL